MNADYPVRVPGLGEVNEKPPQSVRRVGDPLLRGEALKTDKPSAVHTVVLPDALAAVHRIAVRVEAEIILFRCLGQRRNALRVSRTEIVDEGVLRVVPAPVRRDVQLDARHIVYVRVPPENLVKDLVGQGVVELPVSDPAAVKYRRVELDPRVGELPVHPPVILKVPREDYLLPVLPRSRRVVAETEP